MPMRPFVAGTRRIDEPAYDETRSLAASSIDLPQFDVDPNGYLTGLFVIVECTGTNAGAATAFAADGPFNVLDLVNFQDTNSQPVVGPMNGYDLYVLNKYGGYAFVDDAKQSPAYSVTTGAGATGGSFSFILYVPVEIVRRDALGALPNKSSSSTFSLDLRLAPLASVYTVAPNGAPAASVRVRIVEVGWQDPNATDIRNNPVAQDPPGVQTTQYWARQTYTLASGSVDQRLQSIDAMVRELIWIARDENNSRQQGDTEFPDPFTFQYETSLIVQRPRTLWRHMLARDFGYVATVETAGGRDYGVYPLWFNQDFGLKPGAETRYQYLPVSNPTSLVARGTIGGTGANVYTLLVNKVVPAGGNPLVLTGGR